MKTTTDGIRINVNSIKPTRVVINSYGDGVSPERAERDYDIKSDIIFIRNDGWTLGTPHEFETIAYSLWKHEWTSFLKICEGVFRDISEYIKE